MGRLQSEEKGALQTKLTNQRCVYMDPRLASSFLEREPSTIRLHEATSPTMILYTSVYWAASDVPTDQKKRWSCNCRF